MARKTAKPAPSKDRTAAARAKRYRERKRQEAQGKTVTPVTATVTPEKEPRVTPERFKVEARLTKVEELYLLEKTQAEIAIELERLGFGVAQQTVSRDIKAIRDEWRRARIEGFGWTQERELRKVDTYEREALKDRIEALGAWTASKGVVSEPANRISAKGQPPETPPVQVLAKGLGDPRYLHAADSALARALDCVRERCKIIGHYAPKVRIMRTDEKRNRLATLLGAEPNELALKDKN